jgi:membrane-bound ClpP family serine protease
VIANIINSLIGIWVVYLAVLNPSALEAGKWTFVIAGLTVLVLALIARQTDHSKWHSSTDAVLGIVLIVAGIIQEFVPLEALAFWVAFWIGVTVAVVSLWAAIYSPRRAAT